MVIFEVGKCNDSRSKLSEMPTSLKWGALAVAILDCLLQVFASFYLLYRLLSIFAVVMAAYDSVVVFTFSCKSKVFNGILGLWQIMMVFYSGILISQWFNLALIVSIFERNNIFNKPTWFLLFKYFKNDLRYKCDFWKIRTLKRGKIKFLEQCATAHCNNLQNLDFSINRIEYKRL